MYTNETTHFSIPLPLGSDLTTPMDYNQSMEAIDEAIWEATQVSDTAIQNSADAKEISQQAATDVGEAQQDILTLRGQQTVLTSRVVSLEAETADVRQDGKDMICAYQEASATASRTYSVGDYFIYNEVLYKASDRIVTGDTIVPNTNCVATNVATELGKSWVRTTDEVAVGYDVDGSIIYEKTFEIETSDFVVGTEYRRTLTNIVTNSSKLISATGTYGRYTSPEEGFDYAFGGEGATQDSAKVISNCTVTRNASTGVIAVNILTSLGFEATSHKCSLTVRYCR